MRWFTFSIIVLAVLGARKRGGYEWVHLGPRELHCFLGALLRTGFAIAWVDRWTSAKVENLHFKAARIRVQGFYVAVYASAEGVLA
jgi:hypothetical protein